MKVLHVIETLAAGGAERALVDSALTLKPLGVDSRIVALWGEPAPDLLRCLQEAGIEYVNLGLKRRWGLYAGAAAIAAEVSAWQPRLVHCHLYFSGVYTGLARSWFGIAAPALITFHNLAYAKGCNKPGPALWLRKTLSRWLLRKQFIDTIAVSAAVASHYQHHLNIPLPRVIHNGTGACATEPVTSGELEQLRSELNLPNGPFILCAGRLVEEKAIDRAIDIFAQLLTLHPHVKLVIAGSGPLQDCLRERVDDLGLQAEVFFTGGLEHRQLLALMQCAQLLLAPSRYEGFGLVVAEAMAVGLPVATTAVGGTAELVGDTALVLGETSALDNAGAIGVLLEDTPRRNDMAAVARQRVLARFSLTAVAKQLHALYLERAA